jgi:hypothetical protein
MKTRKKTHYLQQIEIGLESNRSCWNKEMMRSWLAMRMRVRMRMMMMLSNEDRCLF